MLKSHLDRIQACGEPKSQKCAFLNSGWNCIRDKWQIWFSVCGLGFSSGSYEKSAFKNFCWQTALKRLLLALWYELETNPLPHDFLKSRNIKERHHIAGADGLMWFREKTWALEMAKGRLLMHQLKIISNFQNVGMHSTNNSSYLREVWLRLLNWYRQW